MPHSEAYSATQQRADGMTPKQRVEIYVNYLRTIQMLCSNRVKFLIDEVVGNSESNWTAKKDAGPKRIKEVHRDRQLEKLTAQTALSQQQSGVTGGSRQTANRPPMQRGSYGPHNPMPQRSSGGAASMPSYKPVTTEKDRRAAADLSTDKGLSKHLQNVGSGPPRRGIGPAYAGRGSSSSQKGAEASRDHSQPRPTDREAALGAARGIHHGGMSRTAAPHAASAANATVMPSASVPAQLSKMGSAESAASSSPQTTSRAETPSTERAAPRPPSAASGDTQPPYRPPLTTAKATQPIATAGESSAVESAASSSAETSTMVDEHRSVGGGRECVGERRVCSSCSGRRWCGSKAAADNARIGGQGLAEANGRPVARARRGVQ